MHHINKFIASKKTPRDYLLSPIEKDKSNETIISAGFAIKFYLNIRKKESTEIQDVLDNLPNVKREKKLPIILSKEEIEKLITATTNS